MMPNEILKTMRALREDMRQRLLQVPEYRALAALDRSIAEICAIMQDALAQAEIRAAPPESGPAPASSVETPPAPPSAERHNAIATAFAETLAAKMDQRHVARAANSFAAPLRALG